MREVQAELDELKGQQATMAMLTQQVHDAEAARGHAELALASAEAAMASVEQRLRDVEDETRRLQVQVEVEQSEKLEQVALREDAELGWQHQERLLKADLDRLTAELASERSRASDLKQALEGARFVLQQKEASHTALVHERSQLDAELREARLAQQTEVSQRSEMARLHGELDRARAHAVDLQARVDELQIGCDSVRRPPFGGGGRAAEPSLKRGLGCDRAPLPCVSRFRVCVGRRL